jgi:hypothetical protein
VAPVVALDYVDPLARSYRDRAGAAGPARSMAFRLLALATDRLEPRLRSQAITTTAAGWSDAECLGAAWVPNVIEAADPIDDAAADRDVVFFGNLAYPPNVSALRRLARMWPEIRRRRPGTSVVVGGARPSPALRRLIRAQGWDLVPDFADVRALCSRARLSFVPLVHASGIQNKVLEAAAIGMPQVISAAAAAGVDPDFPALVARDDEEFIAMVTGLLDDPGKLASWAKAAHAHVAARYRPEAWAPWVRSALSAAR